jgi:23S rRNA pseudouridine1911/1915/1917 synthase
MSERAITHVVVDPDDAGQRADVVLARHVPELSRRVARALALAGKLRIDDRPAPPSARVALGQTLALALGPAHDEPPGEPRIVHVTDRFVYADKPTGWHTHRLRPDDPPTLADAIAREHPECAVASQELREGGAIHRLDRETTGLVVFARTPAAWADGRAAMTRAATVKLYVALGRAPAPFGWPPAVADVRRATPPTDWPDAVERPPVVEAWSITAPLGRGADRTRVSVRADGVAAHTIVMPIGVGLTEDPRAPARLAFVVRLHTGHRHQARVHLAHLGWPILGDARYDPHADGEPPQEPHAGGPLMLHCARIDLSASCPGEPSVDAALPPHLALAFAEAALVPWAGRGAP